jgi:hypothetical protein
MKNITYIHDGDTFVLHQDGTPLTNPHGVVIATTSEELAQKLVEELKEGKSYTSASALLAYHYTYCNLEHDDDRSELDNYFKEMMDSDHLMTDEYLMFHQSCPIPQVVANALSEDIDVYFPTLNLYQQTAILVAAQTYQSVMLPYYIITDICEPLEEGEDYELLKSHFMEDLEAFEREQGYAEEYEDYAQHLTNLSGMIDAFVYYYNLFADEDEAYYDEDYDPLSEVTVSGEGVVRDISYYENADLINLSLHMSNEELYVNKITYYVGGVFNPTIESNSETIIVPDASQLMAVLGVNNKEDVIDALMEHCGNIFRPLDFDELLNFLQTNNLAYTRKS